MTVDEYAGHLGRTTAEILESAAFVFTEPHEGEITWTEELFEAQLDFSGHTTGKIMIALPMSLGAELVANLLGLEPGEDPEIAGEIPAAVCELLNMIAGPVLAGWYGEDTVNHIGIPTGSKVSPGAHTDWRGDRFISANLITEMEQHLQIAAVFD